MEIEDAMGSGNDRDALALIFRRSMLWTPDRQAPSAWIEHVPFAFWLVDVLRPHRIVELGTHNGVSYSAMCQAVKTLGLATSCFAIDTWKGDEHAGFYDDDVYRDFAAFHDPRYGAFSRLIRSTFDDALHHFEDGSIDLLHIDGLHTYEAVRHDYQSWLPKLSANAVVLLHDTNVQKKEFGVLRLWKEIAAGKPHFNFLHGYGLGVLGQGDDYSGALRIFFDANRDARLARSIREIFGAIGCSVPALNKRSSLDKLLSERAQDLSRLWQALGAREEELTAVMKTLAERNTEIDVLREALTAHQMKVSLAETAISALRSSTSWRITAPLRAAKYVWISFTGTESNRISVHPRIKKGLKRILGPRISGYLSRPVKKHLGQELSYDRWVREYDTLDEIDRAAIRAHIAELSHRPLISVVMPVYNTAERYLREAIESVIGQLYPYWELCIGDDASTEPHVRTLLEDYRRRDPRIKVIYRPENGHISAASNSALELATGEFVALLDHDDRLSERALYEIAVELNVCPAADVVYSDSDNVDDNGRRWSPYFKTDWNLDLMLGHNMVSHLGVYRRTLMADIGGLRVGFEGSQDYDLMLRAAEASTPGQIRHVPAILYHWRRCASSPAFSETNLERCVAAARRAITEHFVRTGITVRVEPAPKIPQWTRIVYPLPGEPPLVSIIVPTRDRADFLRRCTDGILKNTNYPQLELLIVDNDSDEPETHRLFEHLKQDPRVRILRHQGNFNFAAMNNRAVVEARGEVIVLMNDGVEVISPSWLEEMVSQALRREVGAVGATLLYPDGRVQHAGVVLGIGHGAGHFFHLSSREDVGSYGLLSLARRVSAVTAACMALRRSVYLEIGGFDEINLPVAYNDVDLCLRIGDRGYAVIWTPYAELYHHESVSWGCDFDDDKRLARFNREASYLRQRWSELLDRDPYYNPNCSMARAHFEPGFPPRRQKPWHRYKEQAIAHESASGEAAVPAASGSADGVLSTTKCDLAAVPPTATPSASRADQLLAPIDRSARIIEIGPSYNPIAPKASGWNTITVDHASRFELVKKYVSHPSVDVSRIEEVDFVWTGGPLAEAVPRHLHGTFDALIASHVIEHTTDLIGFLDTAETLLSPSGVVILAVPDKRYCFDYFRPLTTTGEVLYANLSHRSRHTRRIVFDHTAYVVKNCGTGAWGQHPVGEMEFSYSLDEADQAFVTVSEDPSDPYVDMHAWQFTPTSFELVLLELARLRKTDWQIQRVTPATGCEFHAWLRRGGEAAAAALSESALNARRLTLLKQCLLQTREQIDFLLAGDPSLHSERKNVA